jgi:hypothetical protein
MPISSEWISNAGGAGLAKVLGYGNVLMKRIIQ